ncbi:hypothetical protein GW17_00004398 [Ensete ventricosum]|nr:hypothetical protein GW17_00004398 [Ensete ventricosum]
MFSSLTMSSKKYPSPPSGVVTSLSPVTLTSLTSVPSFPNPHLPFVYHRYKDSDQDRELARDSFPTNVAN